ncbi:ANTAR domain-containing protein [Streptomyces sp. NPDC059788]|uniref:ANTAR domain-containing protein n=1 Tax=Streptomyces sp. NPDC059788 TaxID=3346948 RepID=UPI003663A9C3
MPATAREVRVAEAVRDLVHRDLEFDPPELLHDLTARTLALLPVSGAAVTVLDELGRVEYAIASDERCHRLEAVQSELDEGPGVDASRTRTIQTATALSGPGSLRWPRFTHHARRAGITAVAAVPMRAPGFTVGALTLLGTTAPPPAVRELRIAQAMADAAATCFGHRQHLQGQALLIEQLQTALDSRLVIEQAKGVLSERLRITMDEAFERMRRHARARQRKLTDLAKDVARGAVPADLDLPMS